MCERKKCVGYVGNTVRHKKFVNNVHVTSMNNAPRLFFTQLVVRAKKIVCVIRALRGIICAHHMHILHTFLTLLGVSHVPYTFFCSHISLVTSVSTVHKLWGLTKNVSIGASSQKIHGPHTEWSEWQESHVLNSYEHNHLTWRWRSGGLRQSWRENEVKSINWKIMLFLDVRVWSRSNQPWAWGSTPHLSQRSTYISGGSSFVSSARLSQLGYWYHMYVAYSMTTWVCTTHFYLSLFRWIFSK
jgi:hypothetical protein